MEVTIIIVLIMCLVGCAISDSPVVHTSMGSVKGYVDRSSKGSRFYSFLSIPFAVPPIGSLRFKPPEPASSWNGLLDGTRRTPICLQADTWEGAGVVGVEDCLYLNVYTRKLPSSDQKLLPVMLWIHGGSYVLGSGSPEMYPPNALMNEEIVLVSTNYRLNAFGFLSTGDDVVQGNMALKDQTMAMRWIKANIASFGGDPKRVTIAGESAGGSSVHYHLLSPLSRGLFQQAISQSGSALCPWAYMSPEEISYRSKQFAKILDCPTDTSVNMLKCLQAVDGIDIANALNNVSDWCIFPAAPFAPTKEVGGKERFMPLSPRETLDQGKVADIPWMTGVTQSEGEYIAAGIWKQGLLDDFNKNYRKVMPILFNYQFMTKNPDPFSWHLRKYYFGDKDISEDTLDNLITLCSDLGFKYPGMEVALEHRNIVKSPIYFYLMTFEGSFSFSQNSGPIGGGLEHKPRGTCHADDLYYIFQMPPMDYSAKTPEGKMSNKFVAWWTNFVATGNPTPPKGKESKAVWKPIESSNQFQYFDINLTPSMKTEMYDKESLSFLKDLPNYMKRENTKEEL